MRRGSRRGASPTSSTPTTRTAPLHTGASWGYQAPAGPAAANAGSQQRRSGACRSSAEIGVRFHGAKLGLCHCRVVITAHLPNRAQVGGLGHGELTWQENNREEAGRGRVLAAGGACIPASLPPGRAAGSRAVLRREGQEGGWCCSGMTVPKLLRVSPGASSAHPDTCHPIPGPGGLGRSQPCQPEAHLLPAGSPWASQALAQLRTNATNSAARLLQPVKHFSARCEQELWTCCEHRLELSCTSSPAACPEPHNSMPLCSSSAAWIRLGRCAGSEGSHQAEQQRSSQPL